MRSYPQKVMDFWDDLGIWNQWGIAVVTGIFGFVLMLEGLHALYGT